MLNKYLSLKEVGEMTITYCFLQTRDIFWVLCVHSHFTFSLTSKVRLISIFYGAVSQKVLRTCLKYHNYWMTESELKFDCFALCYLLFTWHQKPKNFLTFGTKLGVYAGKIWLSNLDLFEQSFALVHVVLWKWKIMQSITFPLMQYVHTWDYSVVILLLTWILRHLFTYFLNFKYNYYPQILIYQLSSSIQEQQNKLF